MVECGVLAASSPADPTDPPAADPDHPPVAPRSRAATLVAIAAGALLLWVLVIAVARAWGLHLESSGTRLVLFTPPVLGGYRSEPPLELVPIAALGAVLAVVLPRVVDAVRWTVAVGSATAGAAAWWIGLALVDGPAGLTRGLYFDADYSEAARQVASGPGRYLAAYVPNLAGQPIALRGHPPGFALLFGALEAIGLGGERWAAAVVIVISLSAVPAILLAVRAVAGEGWARRAAPFIALAPAAAWIVTSTDGVTMATVAWAVALLALAGNTDRMRRGDLLAAAAGVLSALAVLQSYGMALMAVPLVVLALHQRRWRPLLVAAAAGAAVVLALAGWGFWILDGLDATLHEYHTLEVDRPYSYFLFANFGAWALALGPATAVGLALLRDRRMWVLVGAGLGSAVLAGVSGLSEGEVERIWLPFTLLVLPVGACLWRTRRQATGWLLAQVASVVALTSVIGTNW